MHKSFRAGLAMMAAGLVTSSLLVAGTASASSPGATSRHVCADAPAGYASCDSLVRITASGHNFVSRNVGPNVNPGGYHPADLQSAYKLSAAIGHTGTVAIVDAFDNPNVEKDLQVYRKQFGLPVCTTANGCFKKVNQNGATSPLPAGNSGWGEEISLDVDMVSAICPKCHIVLVEATTNSFNNLGTAAHKAGTLAHIVSNSYGGNDGAGAQTLAHFWTAKGVQQVVSSGDHNFNGNSAAGPQVPAAFQSVTAVGGTALKRASNARGFTETVWFGHPDSTWGAGSGCSVSIAKPAWQHDTICKKRMIADVSADADPNTGVSVYDTFGAGGWLVFGGTSAAAPIIAGVYALAGNASTIANNASHTYANTSHLFDVTSGSNGTCGGNYECTAKPGYDGPTGNGTPNGVAAF